MRANLRLDTLEEEREFPSEGRVGCINALAVWEGQLISGHDQGKVRVWDVGTGERQRELAFYSHCVYSLCVVESRLASGSLDEQR